jgi:hypothetical protein
MGMSTGGIPTIDNIPETTEIFGYIVSWTPEFFSCLGYIVSCGYPTRTHTHTRGLLQLLMYDHQIDQILRLDTDFYQESPKKLLENESK